MSDAKSLTEEQIGQIRNWAETGAGLSEIQRRLESEFGLRLTYMDTRFLLGDHQIHLVEEEKESEEKEPDATGDPEVPAPEANGESEIEEPQTPPEADSSLLDEDGAGSSSVTVTISELQRPGAMVSGNVTFEGGEVADWWMDQFGRLGMDPKNPEFKPSEADLRAFQTELQRVAQQKGF